MPAHPRSRIVDQLAVGVYHCVNRCVRRAFLCGPDAASGRNFDHRKVWIRQRLETLAGLFAIDVLGFAVMANHLHLVLRNRPDVAAGWSDEEVAHRWCALFPRSSSAAASHATAGDVGGRDEALRRLREQMLLADPAQLAECRRRLSSLSWLMRCLCEPIARAANREDRVTGRFWEGRFKCQALLDEAAVLACSLYVDLNPIRAGLADTPETSFFTSACERIADRRAGAEATAASGWLSPVPTADVPSRTAQPEAAPARRASHQGFLPLSLDAYLRLLDWTGRQIRAGCSGRIPADLQPIFQRLRLDAEAWAACVLWFGRHFRRVVGRAASMERFADRAGQHWMQGIRHSRQAFG